PKFFYPIQKVFSAGRLVGAEKGPYSVPHSVLLSALPDNIYLHKLDQEIGRIQQKYEILIVQRIRSVLLRTGRIDDQEDSREEASFNPPQDNRAIIVGRVKSIQRKAAFHSLVLSWHTPPTSTPQLRGDQKRSFVFLPSSALAAFLNKPSSLLCAAFLIETAGLTPKAEFYGRERCNINWAMRDFFKNCKRKGLLIELGGDAILVIRSERGLAQLLIEIKKLLAHFLQSGLNLWVGSAGSTTIAARSTVEFLGTIIREVPPRTTPIQFLRELEKRLRVKHRIHITACHLCSAIHSKFRNLGNSILIKELTKGMSGTGSLLDAVQLADSLGTPGEVSRLGMSVRKMSLYTLAGLKAAGEREGDWARSIRREFPIQIEVPRQPLLSLNDFRPPDPLVCNIQLGPQAQILSTEYNPKQAKATLNQSMNEKNRLLRNRKEGQVGLRTVGQSKRGPDSWMEPYDARVSHTVPLRRVRYHHLSGPTSGPRSCIPTHLVHAHRSLQESPFNGSLNYVREIALLSNGKRATPRKCPAPRFIVVGAQNLPCSFLGGAPAEIELEALTLPTSRHLMAVGHDYYTKAPMNMNISHGGVCIFMLGVLLSCDPKAYVRLVAHASYLFRAGSVNSDSIRKHPVLTTLRDTKAQVTPVGEVALSIASGQPGREHGGDGLPKKPAQDGAWARKQEAMAFALVGAIKHLRLFHSIFKLDRKVETFRGILFLRDALLRYDGIFDSLTVGDLVIF
nr:maturase, mitochondrial [Tanacetum cinerariifolium]